jgi:DNA-binding transcriptional regulator YdaS (Cro superfamily)
MNELKTFLAGLATEERDAFAARCETSAAHLRNISYGSRVASARLSVAIERQSNGAVTRQHLHPDEWPTIWPELQESVHA